MVAVSAAGPAQVARDEAMNRAESSAPAEWKRDAETCVRALAVLFGEITTDDVWDVIGQPPEPRALGPVMRAASRVGVLVRTGQYRQSERPENHARPVAIWAAGPMLSGTLFGEARRTLDRLAVRYGKREA